MITIGIDPSINSTGICINSPGGSEYYIICSKLTKKMREFKHKRVHIINYEKTEFKELEYSDKEFIKTRNIRNIVSEIEKIIKKYKKKDSVMIYMEGISYGSAGSAALVDLAGLNFLIRSMLLEQNIPFIIVAPISLKIFATNNAGASKEEMTWAWKLLDPGMNNIENIKIDDLADAYFLSRFTK